MATPHLELEIYLLMVLLLLGRGYLRISGPQLLAPRAEDLRPCCETKEKGHHVALPASACCSALLYRGIGLAHGTDLNSGGFLLHMVDIHSEETCGWLS
eukprot:s29_g32.t1